MDIGSKITTNTTGRLLLLAFLGTALGVAAQKENNSTASKQILIQKALKKAMEKEKKYAKEQRFYGADEYDFKGAQVDPETLKSIEAVEPDYNHTDDWGVCDSN